MLMMKQRLMTIPALLCVVVLLLTSCAQSKLKIAVMAANQNCPISVGMGLMELKSLDYENDNVMLNLNIKGGEPVITGMQRQPMLMKEAVKMIIGSQQGRVKEITNMLVNANASVTFVFSSGESIEKARISLTPQELREVQANAGDVQQQLNSMMKVLQGEMPIDLENLENLENMDIDQLKGTLNNIFGK